MPIASNMFLCFYEFIICVQRWLSTSNEVARADKCRYIFYVTMLIWFYAFMRKNIAHLRQRIRRVELLPGCDERLGQLSRWVNTQQGRAIIHINGRPAAVLVTYTEYRQLEKQRTTEMIEQLLTQLHKIQQRKSAEDND